MKALTLLDLVLLAIAAAVIAGLQGCAQAPAERAEICFMKPMGRSDQGLSVVASVCMTPERFAETQKGP